jgi:hypothetical protein
MKHAYTKRRLWPAAKKAKSGIVLRIETLEDRNLLDVAPLLPPGHNPPPGPFPNVLVNNPADDGTSAQDTQSETSLFVDGTTVVSAFNDSSLFSASSPHITGFSRSTNGGQSFTDMGGLPNIASGGDAGDPVLAHDNVSGRSYLATLNLNSPSNIDVFRSDNDFQTFLSTTLVNRSGASLDKDWLTVDNFAGAGQGNVYLVALDLNNSGIYFFNSTNQGQSFGPSGGTLIASGIVQGAWVAVGPDHAVYVAWLDQNTATGSIKLRKSTDQGQSFGPAVTITTLQTTGIDGDLGLTGIRVGTSTAAPFRSNAFPQLLANPVTNQLYVVYDDKGAGPTKADVYFCTSESGGSTWENVRVTDDTTSRDRWQPALAVSPDGGKVGVFWYDRRLDSADNLIDRYGAIGVVSGGTVTFGPNFRITDTSFPPEFGRDPPIQPTYMGDYDQAVAAPNGFYLTWGDNRLPSQGHPGNNADVRFAFIPISGHGPGVGIISPQGNTLAPVSTLRVVFDEPINPMTATPDQFLIQDQFGNQINVNSVTPVDSTNIRFDVGIDTQTAAGAYAVTIGPYIADQNGNYMDQDGDGDSGSDPQDAFYGSFTIIGPSVVSTTLTGTFNHQTISHDRLVFNTSVDPNSFTPDQYVLLDPNGSQVNITSITPVNGTNNAQFDITFNPQSASGTYMLMVGPNITDPFGNPMTDPFTSQFQIVNVLVVNGGFETGDFTGWTISGNTGSTSVGTNAHSGTYAARLGPVGSDGHLSQVLPTVSGGTYHLVYWLTNEGGPVNDFSVQLNGVTIPGSVLNNANPFPYQMYAFDFTATGPTALQFSYRQDPSYWDLDDISVTGTGPGPAGSGERTGDTARAIGMALALPSDTRQPVVNSSRDTGSGTAPTQTDAASLLGVIPASLRAGSPPVDAFFARLGSPSGMHQPTARLDPVDPLQLEVGALDYEARLGARFGFSPEYLRALAESRAVFWEKRGRT